LLASAVSMAAENGRRIVLKPNEAIWPIIDL
jgi:hypothetical protein